MRRAFSSTLVLLFAITAATATPIDDTLLINGTVLQIVNNLTLIDHELYLLNGTADTEDDAGTVRKKRTFGDLVFRGLADVLGYSVQRRPPQTVFPPPVAPLPQLNLQVSAQTAQQPCAAAVQAAPSPCTQQQAAPVQPPCARLRQADSPCNLRQRDAPPLCDAQPQTTPKPADVVSSRLQLNFAFNRNNPAAQNPAGDQPPPDLSNDAIERAPKAPFKPQPARLPPPPPPPPRTKKPKVFIDAFVVRRNGETEKLQTADAAQFDPDNYDDGPSDIYDDAPPPNYDYYEDAQESQAQNQRTSQYNNYSPQKQVKYGSRRPAWSQSISAAVPNHNNIPIEEKRKYNPAEKLHHKIETDFLYNGNSEATTSTEDPHKSLVPKILPPTENHPNQIDTVTVRVPPIYRAKNPRKLHQADDHVLTTASPIEEDSKPPKRRRKKKKSTKVRITRNVKQPAPKSNKPDSKPVESNKKSASVSSQEGNYDYKPSKSSSYTASSESNKDPDLERIEAAPPPWTDSSENDKYLADESERHDGNDKYITDESERDSGSYEKYYADDDERDNPATPDPHLSDDSEKTSKLSPNARVYEKGFSNSYAKVVSSRVEDDHKPKFIKVTRKQVDDDDDYIVPILVNDEKIVPRINHGIAPLPRNDDYIELI